ncbi:MAG: hypothetical protein AAFR27_14205, partial [Pseudomonadota bacterium]
MTNLFTSGVTRVTLFAFALFVGLSSAFASGVKVSFDPGSSVFTVNAANEITTAVDELQWSLVDRPPGSLATLVDDEGPIASFVADSPGQFRLELSSAVGGVASLVGTYTVSTENQAPIAKISALSGVAPVAVSQTINLSGAGSVDGDGDLLSYIWDISSAAAGSAAV